MSVKIIAIFRVEPFSAEQIRDFSPKVAEEYAGKTTRTIQRDLEELIELKMVISSPEGFRANFGILNQYYPAARRSV